MSNKVKFISRRKKRELLEKLAAAEEGSEEAKNIREKLGAHAPVDPAIEAAKKKAAEDAAEAAEAEAKKKREIAEAKKKAKATPKKAASKKKSISKRIFGSKKKK